MVLLPRFVGTLTLVGCRTHWATEVAGPPADGMESRGERVAGDLANAEARRLRACRQAASRACWLQRSRITSRGIEQRGNRQRGDGLVAMASSCCCSLGLRPAAVGAVGADRVSAGRCRGPAARRRQAARALGVLDELGLLLQNFLPLAAALSTALRAAGWRAGEMDAADARRFGVILGIDRTWHFRGLATSCSRIRAAAR